MDLVAFYQPALKFQGYCTWDDFGNIMDQKLCWKEIISQTAWFFFFNFAILNIWHAFPRNEQKRLNLHSKNTFPEKTKIIPQKNQEYCNWKQLPKELLLICKGIWERNSGKRIRVNQQPTSHHEGWMVCGKDTFPLGFSSLGSPRWIALFLFLLPTY
jgi:hypothetical protein